MPPYELEKTQGEYIVFDGSKGEEFTVNSGFKSLCRKLKNSWKVTASREPVITQDVLAEAQLYIIAEPRQKLSQPEMEFLRQHVTTGRSLFVMIGDGGETQANTNINFLLEEFGIMVNDDAVVRTAYYKYFHPKEALVSNGVLNRAIAQFTGKLQASRDEDENNLQALTFLYPYGATLNVSRLSIPVLSTGSVCFPLNRPVCAFHQHKSGGKLVVLGSVHMFTDPYIDKEENAKIMDVIFNYLMTTEVKLNTIDGADPEVNDYTMIPDTVYLSKQIKVCLQEGESEMQTRDFSKLFDSSLYACDLSLWPKTMRAYEHLSVKREALTVITPQFEMPIPPLEPAVFSPAFRDLPPPEVELFDLDDCFSTEKVRLAQLTNKCQESDLPYFINECAEILAVSSKLPAEERDPIRVLEFIFNQVVEFKKLNPDQEFMDEDYDEPLMSND